MKEFLKANELIESLNSRYAVKKFEKRENPNLENLENTVKEILRLTPTSFGLQAYKFVVVKDEKIREKLREFSWNQAQVTDSDIFIVFCVPTDFSREYIDSHIDNMKKIKNISDEKALGIADFMDKTIISNGASIGIENFEEWLTRQAYIALGNLMTSLGVLGVDSCPLEGIDPIKYNEILDLKSKNLTAKCAIAIGKRSTEDKYAGEKKVRFSQEKIFINI